MIAVIPLECSAIMADEKAREVAVHKERRASRRMKNKTNKIRRHSLREQMKWARRGAGEGGKTLKK
jgi:hypothetical protein